MIAPPGSGRNPRRPRNHAVRTGVDERRSSISSPLEMPAVNVLAKFSLGARIARGLDHLLAQDGHANVADAVGADHAAWP